MQIEDYHNIKAEQEQVKRQTLNNKAFPNPSNLRDCDAVSETYIELNSDASGQKESIYKFQKNELLEREPQIVDLSKLLLTGIVRQCRKEKLISEEIAHCFFINFTTKMEALYIEYYKANQLHRFDFAKCKINIIDHRRLVEMLIKHNKSKYIPPKQQGPYDFLKEGRDFLREIYLLSLEEYQKIIDQQVNRYYQTWWGGPENVNSVIPQPEILDVEQAARQMEQKEKIQRMRRQEEEQRILIRVGEQRASSNDLLAIANRLSSQLFGMYYPAQDPEIKVQDEQMQKEKEGQDAQSKRKIQTEDKKEKKSKKKSKKKKSKTESEIKKQWIQEMKAKKQAEMERQENQLD